MLLHVLRWKSIEASSTRSQTGVHVRAKRNLAAHSAVDPIWGDQPISAAGYLDTASSICSSVDVATPWMRNGFRYVACV